MQHNAAIIQTQSGNKDASHEPHKDSTIIVNGRPREVSAKNLTFTDIVRLAFEDAVFNDVTIYTVTFKRGHGEKPEGTLVEDESVQIKEGMIFNVTRTDKS